MDGAPSQMTVNEQNGLLFFRQQNVRHDQYGFIVKDTAGEIPYECHVREIGDVVECTCGEFTHHARQSYKAFRCAHKIAVEHWKTANGF